MPGKTLYIPAYWWYSIQFNENTSISCFNYRTYMNNLAVLPYICLHALQIQNVKRNVARKVSINEMKNEIIHPVDQEDLNTNHSNTEDLSNQNIIQNWSATNIDDLPQPIDIDSNIGTNID
jgi:hypothetical protein